MEKKLLLKFGNKRPFKVPENYFNDLEIRVMSQITTKATEINGDKQRDRKNYFTSARHLRPLIIAASFIGLIVVGWLHRIFFKNMIRQRIFMIQMLLQQQLLQKIGLQILNI